jgi:hypothetical protein
LGENEKNIARAFREAQDGAVLLIDEKWTASCRIVVERSVVGK